MSAGPFKQTGLGGGLQAAVSHCMSVYKQITNFAPHIGGASCMSTSIGVWQECLMEESKLRKRPSCLGATTSSCP